MNDDDDALVLGYNQVTQTLVWDDARSRNDGAGLLSLIGKHTVALRHIHIRFGLLWAILTVFSLLLRQKHEPSE